VRSTSIPSAAKIASKRGGELGVPIADQKPERANAVSEFDQ
jgi:hypothetical protein